MIVGLGMRRLLFLAILFCPLHTGNAQTEVQGNKNPDIPTVSFCELSKNPRRYFNKTIRISATMMTGDEGGASLYDPRCPQDLFRIGAQLVRIDDAQWKELEGQIAKFSKQVIDQPRITVTGILRNQPLNYIWYSRTRYRFDILSYESRRDDESEKIQSYSGDLQTERTYRAVVEGDKNFGLNLRPPLKIPIHHSYHLDWTNLDKFPRLKSLRVSSRSSYVLFRVLAVEVEYMGDRRWNSNFRLQILKHGW
jgi:hypothetical protein